MQSHMGRQQGQSKHRRSERQVGGKFFMVVSVGRNGWGRVSSLVLGGLTSGLWSIEPAPGCLMPDHGESRQVDRS